jgi:hypothetical protein
MDKPTVSTILSPAGVLLLALLTACVDVSFEPHVPDVPPGVNVDYYDLSDGIAPDTVYFVALVGEWNGRDTLFCSLLEGERVVEEGWWLDDAVELALAYDPFEPLELTWRAWMAGDTAELVWSP